MPIIFIVFAQHIARSGMSRYRTLFIETLGVTDNPQQLVVIQLANPVAGHCSIATGAFLEQAPKGIQAGLRDGCLPSTLATSLGKLIENSPALHQGLFIALTDQHDVHNARCSIC